MINKIDHSLSFLGDFKDTTCFGVSIRYRRKLNIPRKIEINIKVV